MPISVLRRDSKISGFVNVRETLHIAVQAVVRGIERETTSHRKELKVMQVLSTLSNYEAVEFPLIVSGLLSVQHCRNTLTSFDKSEADKLISHSVSIWLV